MLTGEGRHTVGGESRILRPGDVVFVRPHDTHKYGKVRDGEFSFINLTFTEKTFESMLEYLGEGFPSAELLSARVPPAAAMMGSELVALEAKIKRLGAIEPTDTERLKTSLRILLVELISGRFLGYSPPDNRIPAWLEVACTRMRLGGDFAEGAEKMVAISGKSREHLSRSMKKYMGVTVSEFVNDLRLNYIANMLKNSNRKIADVVFESGFNTLSLASALFKRRYGMGMRQFRKNG